LRESICINPNVKLQMSNIGHWDFGFDLTFDI